MKFGMEVGPTKGVLDIKYLELNMKTVTMATDQSLGVCPYFDEYHRFDHFFGDTKEI